MKQGFRARFTLEGRVPGEGNSPRSSSGLSRSAVFIGAAVLAADLLFVGLATLVTLQSLDAQHTAAAIHARNLARTLETGLTASFDRIDLALQAAVDEHRRQVEAGAIDGPALEALLVRMRERTGNLLSLRVVGPDGIARQNAPPAAEPISFSDREHFTALRDHPDLTFIMARPVMGKVIHIPLIAMSRPLFRRDGRFAGVASGTVSLDHLGELLAAVDAGPHGTISLRWEDMSLVARNQGPGEPDALGVDARAVAQVQAALAGGRTEAASRIRATPDGRTWTWSFRKLGRYPLYVVVGLAPEDYLAHWRRQAAAAWAVVASFVLLTVGGAVYGRVAWRRWNGFERLLVEQTEHLRESEERFRTTFQTIPDPISVSRLDTGAYVMVNEGFTRAAGWTEAEALGRSSLDLGIWVDPADRERMVREIRARGHVENQEIRFRTKSGAVRWNLLSGRPFDLGGERFVLIIVRDITAWKSAEAERDRLQGEIQQAQRLEGIGRLAGGVAHDFNNLLTVIIGAADAIQAEALSPRGREDLGDLVAAALRARDLTGQLLAFARKQAIAPVRLDLATVLRKSEKLLRRVLGEDVALQVELGPDLWPVLFDPAQLEQVILNLAVNARDAMPEGGRLEISACNTEVRPAAAARGGERQVDQWVRLRVRDTGTGMAPEIRAHLFEPFFTTKGVGKGTGLGLATVHGIVAQGGGTIDMETAPGQGTTFDIYLPRTAEPPVRDGPEVAPRARVGHETILLVEDEPLVRSVTARSLRSAGYQVLVAENGPSAIQLAAHHAGALDLLITDVVMPGLSGPQVTAELRRLRPGLPALYLSGYAEDAIVHHGVVDPSIEFLPKPFTADALLDRVRMLIEP
jgi:PAS domain S-box-containing protein